MSASQLENTQQENPQVTVEKAFELAEAHHEQGNLVLAERTYRDILNAVPDHYPTTMFLGILLAQASNFSEALHYLKIAVDTNPNNHICWSNYGSILVRSGDFEGAIGAYNKALEIEPDYVDALNNKAYALWSTQSFSDAETVLQKALDIDPENVNTLNHMGVTLSKLVRYEEAYDMWEKAHELQPENAEILSNWSNALRETARLKDAEDKAQKAVDLNPKYPEALNNLANVVRDLGRSEEAIELYRRATNIKPDYFEAHGNMSIAYSDNGLFEDAVVAARYAVAFNTDFGEGYVALAYALGETAEFLEAVGAAQKAINLLPDQAAPYLGLSDTLLRMNQSDDAEAALREALKREPDSARVYAKLATIYENLNKFDQAHETIDKAIEMSPSMGALLLQKAMFYYTGMDMENALKTIDKALQLDPGRPAILVHKAEMLISLNRNDEAEELLDKVLATTKALPGPYLCLISLKKIKSVDDSLFADMAALEKDISKFGHDIVAAYYYGMGDVYELSKEYDKAFEYYKKASDIKHKMRPFVEESEEIVHQSFANKYTKELIAQASEQGYESDMPIFIVGMPRSGTTLTEQIISSHPQVYGAGELNDIGTVYKKITADEVPGENKVYEAGKLYVEMLKKHDLTGKAKHITDKMPANYIYMGFIASILPNAKIIHCRRHPIDTLLSCYKQNFSRGQRWSYDLEDMASQYERYMTMMDHYREVMPDRFIEVNYEDTVTDFEAQARRLIAYVGLEWDDACLEPHKQKRTVLTASKAQVTQPVYKTSVEKWRNYEKHFQPLLRLLPDGGQ